MTNWQILSNIATPTIMLYVNSNYAQQVQYYPRALQSRSSHVVNPDPHIYSYVAIALSHCTLWFVITKLIWKRNRLNLHFRPQGRWIEHWVDTVRNIEIVVLLKSWRPGSSEKLASKLVVDKCWQLHLIYRKGQCIYMVRTWGVLLSNYTPDTLPIFMSGHMTSDH